MSESNGLLPPGMTAEQVVAEWQSAVGELFTQLENWCREFEGEDWFTRRSTKRVKEAPLGRYEVPMLLLQRWDVRLLAEPLARFSSVGEGLIDISLIPGYDDLASLYRHGGGWRLRDEPWRPESEQPLSRETFRHLLDSFVRRHAEA